MLFLGEGTPNDGVPVLEPVTNDRLSAEHERHASSSDAAPFESFKTHLSQEMAGQVDTITYVAMCYVY